jgi:adenosine deaminase
MTRQQIRELIQKIPKTEIHVHIEAMATPDTVWRLIERHKLAIPGIATKEDLLRRFKVRSLDEFIDLFINILQNCLRTADDFDLVLEDARAYLKRNNIVYAEIFIAPSKLISNGIDFAVITEKLDRAMDSFKRQDGIDVRFLVDVSRSYGVENAQKNVELTIAHRGRSVIGIGLGGSEAAGPARDYGSVFARAIDADLRVVAHAGEDVGPESIWDALNVLKASRIGHGISAIQDAKLMEYLAEKRIPLEICPTSNLFTGRYVKKLTKHPIRAFYDKGMKVTVNTDDPLIFGVELVDEYANLADHGFFKTDELVTLVGNGVFSTFLSAHEKADLWSRISRVLADNGLPPSPAHK